MPSAPQRRLPLVACLMAAAGLPALHAGEAAKDAAAPSPSAAAAATGDADLQARRLLRIALQKIADRETDQGVQMLLKLVDEFPNSQVRFNVWLELGKHYQKAKEESKAIDYLRRLAELEKPGTVLTPDLRELYLESLYLIGVSHFNQRNYNAAFPHLRKITSNYPNSVWANQAYYYIGMAHYNQGNWTGAIEYLGMVGTFVDPESPAVEYVEAGRRFYVKLQDADLPILNRQGKAIRVEISSASGDKEVVAAIPLAEKDSLFIASVPTAIGLAGDASKGDGTLSVIGGDRISTRYVDANTKDGTADVPRQKQTLVVSTGAVSFTLGNFDGQADNAFISQPAFVLLQDVDLDVSDKADAVTLKIVSRYEEEADDATTADLFAGKGAQQKTWRVRDEAEIVLAEQPLAGQTASIRSGRFTGQIPLVRAGRDAAVDKGDRNLACEVGDQVFISYQDEIHAGGKTLRVVEAKIRVAGEFSVSPTSTGKDPDHPLIAAKKNLVEGQAFLELARIFKSMGLSKQAGSKAAEGMSKAQDILRREDALPAAILEQGYKLTWELHLAQNELAKAIEVCKAFTAKFPRSSYADQALLGIAKAFVERRQWAEALKVLNQIIALPSGAVKPEAQFLIATTVESEALDVAADAKTDEVLVAKQALEKAIPFYKQTAERYPDSEFAGESLAKLVKYYMDTKDFTQANDLLVQIFVDHPDKDWLDKMLLRWVALGVAMKNYQLALDKCNQLLEEYPNRPSAKTGREWLPKIEKMMGRASSAQPAAAPDGAAAAARPGAKARTQAGAAE